MLGGGAVFGNGNGFGGGSIAAALQQVHQQVLAAGGGGGGGGYGEFSNEIPPPFCDHFYNIHSFLNNAGHLSSSPGGGPGFH